MRDQRDIGVGVRHSRIDNGSRGLSDPVFFSLSFFFMFGGGCGEVPFEEGRHCEEGGGRSDEVEGRKIPRGRVGQVGLCEVVAERFEAERFESRQGI